VQDQAVGVALQHQVRERVPDQGPASKDVHVSRVRRGEGNREGAVAVAEQCQDRGGDLDDEIRLAVVVRIRDPKIHRRSADFGKHLRSERAVPHTESHDDAEDVGTGDIEDAVPVEVRELRHSDRCRLLQQRREISVPVVQQDDE
jgi:hypothetical protein